MKTSSRARPATASSSSRIAPARPTKGRPRASSLAPGASPTITTGAVALPSPGTRFVACSQISKPHGTCSRISSAMASSSFCAFAVPTAVSYPFGATGTTALGRGPILVGMTLRAYALAIAAGLGLADASIVTLALPDILRQLDTSVEGVAAVIGVYTVVLAVTLIPFERAASAYSVRAVGAGGFALFAVASAACAG